MKKFVAFRNLSEQQNPLDQKHIVEFSDEWLYKCPEFLGYDPDISGDKLKEKMNEFKGGPGKRAFLTRTSLNTGSREFLPLSDEGVIKGLIADIPKSRKGLQNQKANKGTLGQLKEVKRSFKHILNKNLLDNLVQWRTADDELIKRRLIWLPLANEDTASLCCLAAPPSEQEDLLAFFDSHAMFEKKFLDDTTAVTNTWTTEFHLSFYQLNKDEPLNISKGNGSGPRLIPLRRGTMGFRFNGDFFDRYWTCHIVECNCKGDQELRSGFKDLSPESYEVGDDSDIEKPTRERFFGENGDVCSCQRKLLDLIVKNTSEPWHQRKVLELILFHEMTEQVTIFTEEILERIRTGLVDIKNESNKSRESNNSDNPKHPAPSDAFSDILSEALFFDKIDSGAYFFFSKRWEELQQVLQILDDDLEETLDKILSWESREKDRGSEKPRWTTKDEKKYRSALTKLTRSNGQNVRRLQRLQANARSLRSALLNTRDYIREELHLRGAERTRYFTYVTVVFLPLGFATGIFSTSGTPSGLTAVWIVVAAVVALLLTVLALHFDQQIAALKHGLEDQFPWLEKPGKSTREPHRKAVITENAGDSSVRSTGNDAGSKIRNRNRFGKTPARQPQREFDV